MFPSKNSKPPVPISSFCNPQVHESSMTTPAFIRTVLDVPRNEEFGAGTMRENRDFPAATGTKSPSRYFPPRISPISTKSSGSFMKHAELCINRTARHNQAGRQHAVDELGLG